MAVTAYPADLPDFLSGKTRTEVQKYRTSDQFYGAFTVEKLTDESPVTWRVNIKCKDQTEANAFWDWFNANARGGKPFTKQILTEYGHITHEVKFITEPTSVTNDRHIFDYSAEIMARELLTA